MRILYYSMQEVTEEDACQTLREMGHEVRILREKIRDYSIDYEFGAMFQKVLEEGDYDLIFCFYFIPLIAKLAFLKKIRYVVWMFDAMPLTLYSEMVFSPYNYIFSFDREDCERLRTRGVEHIWHLPLAVNVERVKRQIAHPEAEYTEHEISFLGSLYNDRYDSLDRIKDLPERMKGYLDAIAMSQIQIPGVQLAEELVTEELVTELKKWAAVECGGEYTYTEQEVFTGMIIKRVTVRERQLLLERLSQHFPVALYTESDSSGLPGVKNYGYAGYWEKMPLVFSHSKINLNITYREIRSGIPLRALDIMGAGGFLLSNYQPELAEYFEPGRDFAMYGNPSDLVEKAAYYLEHEEERRRIAACGQRKVEEGFTYEKQLGKLFHTLDKYKG